MNRATVESLLAINRRFYEERGRDFSATRLRLQPGVKRLIEGLGGDESILDLGCGNGELARWLSRRGHRGSYLGLDQSTELLAEAAASSFGFPVDFRPANLADSTWDRSFTSGQALGPPQKPFGIVLCFAVLHHIPSGALRSSIACKVHDVLADAGAFMLSNWRFTNSVRMNRRIQPWSAAGIQARDVDANDHLLDWRAGGSALRYVHEFDEAELAELASANGFDIAETFYSDGADHQSSLYQVWKKRRR